MRQFPGSCRGRPLMLHTLGDRASGWGMGSMMHEFAVALAAAYAHNRSVLCVLVYVCMYMLNVYLHVTRMHEYVPHFVAV